MTLRYDAWPCAVQGLRYMSAVLTSQQQADESIIFKPL